MKTRGLLAVCLCWLNSVLSVLLKNAKTQECLVQKLIFLLVDFQVLLLLV